MSFLDWWKRKRPGAKAPPAPAGKMTPLGDSMFVSVEANGAVTVMDRDTYDYQQGGGTLPDPAQRDLDGLTITRIRALSGGMFRGAALESAVLVDTSERQSIASFRRCLAIVEGPGAGHCGCLGGPTLELFAGSERVATIGMQHGSVIRWPRWRDDARLQDSEGLTRWLTDHGVDAALLDLLYKNPLPLAGGRVDGWGTKVLSPVEQRVLLAEIHFRRRELDAALTECDAVLRNHPDTGRAYALRGDVRRRRGEPVASIADYTAAIARGYRTADILVWRGVALDGQGQSVLALDDFTEAIALNPRHIDAYNGRGVTYMRLRRWEEAIADLTKAIALDPHWELPYMNRASCAETRSDFASAISDYSSAIGLIEAQDRAGDRPVLAYLHTRRSAARARQGDERGAEADRREALRLDPTLGGE